MKKKKKGGNFRRNKELLKQVSANKLNQTIFENLKNRVDEFDKWLSEYR